jgi:LysM repeat protein
MAIALSVLLLIVLIAVLALTQLDLGQDASDRRKAPPPSSVTTVSTIPITTTTTRAPRGAVKYTVKAGDTLSSIARRFDVSTAAIVAANKLTDPDHLTLGQRLTIPPALVPELLVAPAKVALGANVVLTLRDAKPGERVVFQIAKPNGSFTGPPHVVAPDGTVVTSYTPGGGDLPGTYLLAAHGDQGTDAQAVLEVEPA